MVAKTSKKYTRITTTAFRRLVAENGRDVKMLAELSGQSERQVRRNLDKLANGKEIGKRGYGKAQSLSSEGCFNFMCKKFEKTSKSEIMSSLGLSDSKYRRLEKIITVPDSVINSEDSLAVHVSCYHTQFFIVWYVEGEMMKVGFNQQFQGERVKNDSLCVEVMKIISQNFFGAIEGRKVGKIEGEEEKFQYYLNYFNQLTPQFEMINELRKYSSDILTPLPDAKEIEEIENNPGNESDISSESEGIISDSELEVEDDNRIISLDYIFNNSSSIGELDLESFDCIDGNIQSKVIENHIDVLGDI